MVGWEIRFSLSKLELWVFYLSFNLSITKGSVVQWTKPLTQITNSPCSIGKGTFSPRAIILSSVE